MIRVNSLLGRGLVAMLLGVLVMACGGGGGGDIGGGNPYLSSAKSIDTFSFASPYAIGEIDHSFKTIIVSVPAGTDVTALVANFTTSGKTVMVGTVIQTSGVTANNFTNPVTYRVIAANGTSFNYIVTVTMVSSLAQWAKSTVEGRSSSQYYSVSVSQDGSVYAAGNIVGTGSHNFGNDVTATGVDSLNNLVLVKYTSAGVAQWAKTVEAANNSSMYKSVKAAADGSVYAAGAIYGYEEFDLGNGVTATGTYRYSNNVLLAKYDSSGLAQWARTVVSGGGGSSVFESVYEAPDGSIYAAGYMSGKGTFNFGNGVNVTGISSGANALLVKYDAHGVAQWAKTAYQGYNSSGFSSLFVGDDGSVYVAGSVAGTGTYDFGNDVTITGVHSLENALVVKYSGSGVTQWAKTVASGNGKSSLSGLSGAPDGSIYAAGYIYGNEAFDFGSSVSVTGSYSKNNILLLKYSSEGVAQWARTTNAAAGDSFFLGVSVAADGNVYAAGEINGKGTFNFGNDVTANQWINEWGNIVLVKYSASGTALSAQSIMPHSFCVTKFMDVYAGDPDGYVYAVGNINGTGSCNLGNGVNVAGTSEGTSNILIVKYQ